MPGKSSYSDNHRHIGRSKIRGHLQAQNRNECRTTSMTTITNKITMATTGMACRVKEWWWSMLESREELWDRQNVVGMRSKERGYKWEGRIKIRPPMSNGHSNGNTCLDIDYSPMDVSNNTKTTAIQPLMPLPLSPSPNTNIDPYCTCQTERTPFLCASLIVYMGDHIYQAYFPPWCCHHQQ